MKFLIIAFKSRNELYGYVNILRNHGIATRVINTPSYIASSCTLSIKIDFIHLEKIRNILTQRTPRSFIGLFSVLLIGQQTQAQKLM